MSAYSQLQEREFASADKDGYGAITHQKFVGTGYFDEVAQTVAGGKSSTTALAGSTEAQQFSKPGASSKSVGHANTKSGHGNSNAMDEVAAT
jgi:hypothetical protein